MTHDTFFEGIFMQNLFIWNIQELEASISVNLTYNKIGGRCFQVGLGPSNIPGSQLINCNKQQKTIGSSSSLQKIRRFSSMLSRALVFFHRQGTARLAVRSPTGNHEDLEFHVLSWSHLVGSPIVRCSVVPLLLVVECWLLVAVVETGLLDL